MCEQSCEVGNRLRCRKDEAKEVHVEGIAEHMLMNGFERDSHMEANATDDI